MKIDRAILQTDEPRVLHTGEARVLVPMSMAELEEVAFATSNPETADRMITALGLLDAERADSVQLTRKQAHGRRGVDFPCEECDELAGSFLVEGWYRCANCGYPSK